jgi:preprotein translocase subunit SecD
MLDDALEHLEEKPKEVIKEIEVEKVIEKIVEVEVPVEVEKETVVTVEKEVPGPERIVEVKVEDTTKIKQLEKTISSLEEKLSVKPKETIREVVVPMASKQEKAFREQISQLEKRIKDLIEDEHKEVIIKEKIVYKEKVVEGPSRPVPVEVEVPATGDLRSAATLIANSEMNVNDLSTKEILTMLKDLSAEEVNSKLGFWAVPLPTDDDKTDKDTRYTLKK